MRLIVGDLKFYYCVKTLILFCRFSSLPLFKFYVKLRYVGISCIQTENHATNNSYHKLNKNCKIKWHWQNCFALPFLSRVSYDSWKLTLLHFTTLSLLRASCCFSHITTLVLGYSSLLYDVISIPQSDHKPSIGRVPCHAMVHKLLTSCARYKQHLRPTDESMIISLHGKGRLSFWTHTMKIGRAHV